MVLSRANPPTSPTLNLPITDDAVQKNTDGHDFYLMALDSSALGDEPDKPLYGSYFGGGEVASEHVDGGTSRFDRLGLVYQAVCSCGAGSPTEDFPVTPNAFSSKSNYKKCNLAFFKFQFSGISARFETNNEEESQPGFSVGCAPLTVV